MHREYWLRGVIISSIFFLTGNLLNLSMSYMGNSNSDVSSAMIKVFWASILFQILKVFLLTLLVGVLFNLFYVAAFNLMEEIVNKKISRQWTSWGIVLSIILYFLGTVIYVPQLFVDNFFSKFEFLRSFLYWLTGNFSPGVFYGIFYVINVPIFLLGAFYLLRAVLRRDIFMPLKSFISSLLFGSRQMWFAGFVVWLFLGLFYVFSGDKNQGKKNILIISSDSIRVDRISSNGYFRKTTPNLDELMQRGVQIRGTITTVPRTFPAWVSLLTSSTPLSHEIVHMFPRTRERMVKLRTANDYLKNEGYHTSVISEFAGDIFPRVDLGFSSVRAPEMNFKVIIRQIILERQVFLLPFLLNGTGRALFPEIRDIAKFSDPEMLTDECIEEIEKSGGRPFFISLFYSITHFPFSGNYPYYNKYTDPDYEGSSKYMKQIVVKLGKEGEKKGAKKVESAAELARRVRNEKQVNALYDGCLNELDHEIGRLVGYLKRKGLYENTMVIITSDHGENLYDQANYGIGHGEHLRGNYALEIPFIMLGGYVKDSHQGKTMNKTCSIIDILPTAFNYIGLSVPDFFRGSDVFGASQGKVKGYCETGIWFDNNKASNLFFYHERLDYPDISGLLEVDFNYRHEAVVKQEFQNVIKTAKHRTIYTDRYKLIYVPLSRGVKFELYDYIQDPANVHNLAHVKKDVLKRMKRLFYSYVLEESMGNFKRVGDYVVPFYSDSIF